MNFGLLTFDLLLVIGQKSKHIVHSLSLFISAFTDLVKFHGKVAAQVKSAAFNYFLELTEENFVMLVLRCALCG